MTTGVSGVGRSADSGPSRGAGRRSRNGGRSSKLATSKWNEEVAMKFLRRNFLHIMAAAAALPTASLTARADTSPSHPARIIVGFPAGGPQDITARIIAQWLSDRLG